LRRIGVGFFDVISRQYRGILSPRPEQDKGKKKNRIAFAS
jgi:hypothetical protein